MVALKVLVVGIVFLLSTVQLLASPLPEGKFLILNFKNYNVSASVCPL